MATPQFQSQPAPQVNLLKKRITPDFDGFRRCVLRQGTPKRVHFFEFYQDVEIKEAVAQRFSLMKSINESHPHYKTLREITIQSFLGYDMFQPSGIGLSFPMGNSFSGTRTGATQGQKSGQLVSSEKCAYGPIRTWDDFESYPWPKALDSDIFRELEWIERNQPENMKCFGYAPIGCYKALIGYEAMFYMMYDTPDLFSAILERLQSIFTEYCRTMAQFSCVGVIMGSDDMGFKT